MDKFLNKLINAGKNLENPIHPLLGPNLKGLYLVGLWQHGSKFRNFVSNFIHSFSTICVVTELVDFYQTKNDLMKAMLNLFVTSLGFVTTCKALFFITKLSKWTHLVRMVSEEEITENAKNEPATTKIILEYRKYSRTITYMYWLLVLVTNTITVLTPGLKYASSFEFREQIRNGTEPYPQILNSWFPLDKNKMPGYIVALIFHACMVSQGAGVVAAYDANAVAMMTFLKGQAMIIAHKVRNIFGAHKPISKREVLERIKECHRHSNFINEVYNLLNELLSPVMFIYVIVCSMTICCGVIQLTSEVVSTSQKIWVAEFILAQIFQLFVYCWHSNEVYLETNAISRSILQSNLWRSDFKERKLLILLAGKLERPFILGAGPFTNLSVPTFIDIIKGSYSFYTLFTQMQETK